MILNKSNDIMVQVYEKCHDGEGALYCKSLLDGFDKSKFNFMHYDDIKAGVSIGEHLHKNSEEIYFLTSASFSASERFSPLSLKGKPFKISIEGFSFCAFTAADSSDFSSAYSVKR